jgi:hypothetical protein
MDLREHGAKGAKALLAWQTDKAVRSIASESRQGFPQDIDVAGNTSDVADAEVVHIEVCRRFDRIQEGGEEVTKIIPWGWLHGSNTSGLATSGSESHHPASKTR